MRMRTHHHYHYSARFGSECPLVKDAGGIMVMVIDVDHWAHRITSQITHHTPTPS